MTASRSKDQEPGWSGEVPPTNDGSQRGTAASAHPEEGSPGSSVTKHERLRALTASAVYSLGFIVQRAIGMLLLPLYTRAVTTAQYGDLGLLLSVAAAAAVLFSLGLDTAITRNYFQLEHRPDERAAYIASVWRFLVGYPLVASVGLSVAVWWLPGVRDGISRVDIVLMFLATGLNVAGTTVPLAVLRARRDLKGYFLLTACLSLLTPILTYVFVVPLHMAVQGWFLAGVIANAATLLAAMSILPWSRHTKTRWAYVSSALVFCFPLLPHFMSHWALQVADRLVISGMVSRASLGVYTLAANLAGAMFAVLQALNSGFVPSYGRAGADSRHEKSLRSVVTLQLMATVGITLGGVLLGSTLVDALTPPTYHGASGVIGWLMLGNGFVGIYFVPMNGATIGAGRRNFAFVATMFAATLNIVLLFVLVPAGGIVAASVADAIAYAVLLVLIAGWAHSRPNPVHYEWIPIIRALVVATLCYLAAVFTRPKSSWPALAVETGWVTAYFVIWILMEYPSVLSRLVRREARAVA